jgi:CBS domain-containing protein
MQSLLNPIQVTGLVLVKSEGKMNFVSAILQVKGNDVFSVKTDTSLIEVLELMAEKGIGAVLVMDGGKIAGIFSERDFARNVAKKRTLDLDLPVSELMTKDVFVISSDQTIDECMALMSSTRIRHLPVMDENKLAGLISIGDVVRFSIDDKDLQIQSMEKYILGIGYGQ